MRASLCAEPGDTLAICLPTGAGKSLCAFLPGMKPVSAEGEELGVSIIIVPTVALALDLAKRMEERVGHAIAYRPEEKEAAAAIRARCESGVQGPVIVSPEALVGNLYPALKTAARRGWLRYFVIDEAHMVLSWGDEFRPAFLQLSAARREFEQLAGSRGFATLLLSATLTDYHLRWLRVMFSEEGSRFTVLHAARLRPEPAFWRACAATEAERERWIVEAAFHLPRPCIVYTTRRDDCTRWHDLFARAGFKRLGMMTGDTSPDERRVLLDRWAADKIDLMVATSAFGLGIDKSDVRTVIHAQLPETVDRFYQDVGRAGRDGCASISLLVNTRYDWRAVGGIGRPKFISAAFGLQRWRRMHDASEVLDPASNQRLIDLNTGRELDMGASDYNRAWNLRTLQLLQRVGALEFVHSARAVTACQVAVRLEAYRHLDEDFWNTTIEQLRGELRGDYAHSGELLRRMLRDNDECLANVFASCYRSETFDITAVQACGGCPACRRAGRVPDCGRIIARRNPSGPVSPSAGDVELERLLGGRRSAFIFYPPDFFHDALGGILAEPLWWLATHGVKNFVAPPWLTPLLWRTAAQAPHATLFWHEKPPRNLDVVAAQATAVLLTRPEPSWWPEFWAKIATRPGPSIVFAPADLRCPDVRTRMVRDLVDGSTMDLAQWENRFVA
ncbi:MAG: ATP-dependent DNA helicase RecQ [Verrucomicrobia bacterium]|nr:ATP-dependent DNA helicase RecQ [Verrucomicrobiota bacterium]